MERSSSFKSKVPFFLQPGDTVAVIAPAYAARMDLVSEGCKVLESWGLNVIQNIPKSDDQTPFSGSDEMRLERLQAAMDNPDIKAIFCARGGYGITRFVDRLDFTGFCTSPKWLIGFSDVTALHLVICKLGFSCIHGPMVVHLSDASQEPAVSALKRVLFYGTRISHIFNAYSSFENQIDAELVGGNLTLLINGLGTKTEPETEGKILFLEEVGERYYRIDRMLQHLKRAGKLQNLKAVILGQFVDCEADGFPFSVVEMVRQKVRSDVPVFSGLPVGHGSPTFPLILGALASISISEQGAIFTQNLNTIS